MKKHPVLKNFVSETDQFLLSYDKKHPALSLSQQQEQAKARRISALRDKSDIETDQPLWEDF